MPDKIVDLYEITIYAECDGVRAKIEKYPTKRTDKNFLPLSLTDEMEAKGYSHRMYGRVPVGDLNKLQRCGFGDGCDHVRRHAFCLAEDREKVFNSMRMEIDLTVRRLHERTTQLLASWELDSATLKPATKKCKDSKSVTSSPSSLPIAELV